MLSFLIFFDFSFINVINASYQGFRNLGLAKPITTKTIISFLTHSPVKCSAFKTLTFNAPSTKEFESPTAEEEKYRVWTMNNRDRFKTNVGLLRNKMINMWRTKAKMIQDLISQTDPDLVIVENVFNLPFIQAMKYKWAFIVSTNPLKIANQRDYPTMGSGVSEDWQWFTEALAEGQSEFRANLAEFYREYGLERKPVICNVEPSPW